MKEKENWFLDLLGFAKGQNQKFIQSIILSVLSVMSGLGPYFCIYKIVERFVDQTVTAGYVLFFCGLSLVFYVLKILCFSRSTGLSHQLAYSVVAGLRKKVTDRFLHASLGQVQKFSIGEIKNMIVDKLENIEPPLAHFVPEGAGHLVLPVVSLIALCLIDVRIALSAMITFPAAIFCMMLTFRISGESFEKYNKSNAYMNSVIVEYIEGIEVIKAFGRAGVSYQKYADAIENFRTFVLKWMASTWVTMKLAFALFPSTLIGTLPMSLYLAEKGKITAAQAALAVMISMSMVSSLARLEVFFESTRQMKESVQEILKYLNMKELQEPKERAKIENYDVELKDVHFSYDEDHPENEVIHGVSLKIKQG